MERSAYTMSGAKTAMDEQYNLAYIRGAPDEKPRYMHTPSAPHPLGAATYGVLGP